MAIVYYARQTYNNPETRANVVGVEIEEDQPIRLFPRNGKARFFVRLVTQFAPSGTSEAYGVGSKEIEIDFDAMGTTLIKLINDADQQGQLRNGVSSIISGTI